MASARDALLYEIRLLGGKLPVLSTNLLLRQDGLPRSGQRQPDDSGVAVYFTYKSKQMCFACDKWQKIEHNIQAVRKTIEALRGIERWGTGDMVEQAFSGFATLGHDSIKRSWREVLGFTPDESPSLVDVKNSYRKLSMIHHPDRGGSDEAFQEISNALAEANAAIAAGEA